MLLSQNARTVDENNVEVEMGQRDFCVTAKTLGRTVTRACSPQQRAVLRVQERMH